jgi:hypothetical protein
LEVDVGFIMLDLNRVGESPRRSISTGDYRLLASLTVDTDGRWWEQVREVRTRRL